jgi:molybdopterin synthase sulfur carrier subunit
MPQVELTSQLAQLAECPAIQSVAADTVSEALDKLYAQNEQMRQHIVDGQGTVHSHLALFVDGQMIDRDQLTVEVNENSEIFVMQALSGG